ncbi:MAG TPA: nuclear transport factor 2 family protein [Streptosporangiaceae bacterium]
MLGITTVSVKSALQRARARLSELALAAGQITEPAAPQARALLDQYIAAFENADAAALERLLTQDAVIEATPMRTWFAGRKACVPFLRNHVLRSAGDWRTQTRDSSPCSGSDLRRSRRVLPDPVAARSWPGKGHSSSGSEIYSQPVVGRRQFHVI